MRDYDDKDLVIMAVLLIVVAAMAIPGVSEASIALAEKAFLGLLGIAVGRAMPK